MSRHNNIFDKKGNLTMESRILYAYAMHLSKVEELPTILVEHFWNNLESREEIIELYELYDAEMISEHPHPFFASQSRGSSAQGFDWENLDEALEQVLRAALAEQTQTNSAMERKMVASFKAGSAAFQVFAPKRDAVCVQTIPFVFQQPLSQNGNLHLKNAQGKTIGRFTISKGSKRHKISIADAQKFPSGVYYWTLLVGSSPITNRLYICTEEDARGMLS
ncbi:MAG: hypothetical protein AB8B69_02805 [Chitinophagales bacterium]